MKKVKTAAALLCSACLVLSGTAVPTMADSVKVVTLGADLTQDQKNTCLLYTSHNVRIVGMTGFALNNVKRRYCVMNVKIPNGLVWMLKK